MASLSSRLKLPLKLTIIAGLFVAPLALVTGLMFFKDLKTINALHQEAQGERFIEKIWPVLLTSADNREVESDALDAARRANDTLAARIGAQQKTGELIASLSMRRTEDHDRFQEHFHESLAALETAASGSGLILDNDLASYNMISLLYSSLPKLAEVGQDAADAVAKLSENNDPVTREELVQNFGALANAAQEMTKSLAAAAAADSSGAIERNVAEAIRATDAALRIYHEKATSGAPIGEILAAKSDFIAKLDRAWRAGADQLGVMLHHRSAGLDEELWTTLSLVGVLLALAGALLVIIAKDVTGGINRLVARMKALAQGEAESPIPHSEDANEMGEIARAVIVFRDNLLEMRRLEGARHAAEAKAAADRQKLENDLREGFGFVVEAARRGDFTRRAPENAALGGLSELVTGLNAVCIAAESFLDEVDQAAAALAGGDLTFAIASKFEGKFALVAENLNQAATALAGTVSEVRESAENGNNSSREIRQAADDLSGRAEQQAANLEQTAAALEEMTASVKQNAENSVDAARSAEDASRRAESGGKIAREAVDAMARIEDSAKRIADIIGLIEGIAFQTNLLALNAAVEAVRAGEAGKGFAVVAAEVRTLAQRSSDAAKDVKSLIQTSQSEVAVGAKLVNAAGETLDEIVAAARKAASMIGGISAASREQAEAAGQISSAVAHLDQITQHNSSLAEQSAAAARGMAEESDRLAELVAGFKTGGEKARARPGRAALAKAAAGDARQLNARLADALGGPGKRPAVPPLKPTRGGAQPAVKQDALADDDWSEF